MAGKIHCQGHSRPAAGDFVAKASGSSTHPPPRLTSRSHCARFRWSFSRSGCTAAPGRTVIRSRAALPRRTHSVASGLAAPDADLPPLEIDILHAQAQGLEQAEPASVQEQRDEVDVAGQMTEQGADLVARQHDGASLRTLRPDHEFEALEVPVQNLPIQKEERARGLVLRGRAHAALGGEVSQERRDFRGSHARGVREVVKPHESANPKDVRLLGAAAVVPPTNREADMDEKPGGRHAELTCPRASTVDQPLSWTRSVSWTRSAAWT